jgi:hypothetical protein
MSKKRTPRKPTKPRKTTPQRWPAYYAFDDIGYVWVRDAIRYGNAELLALYLWHADQIDSRVRRELAEMLNPTSKHFWRLDARYRSPGKPTKQAIRSKLVFNENIVNLTKLLSGVDPLDPGCPRTLSDMLDPSSDHELRLDFTQRRRGRPPPAPPRKHWGGFVRPPIEEDRAFILARSAARSRGAKARGPKLLHKQLYDKHNRSTYFRLLRLFSKPTKTADRSKARSPKP